MSVAKASRLLGSSAVHAGGQCDSESQRSAGSCYSQNSQDTFGRSKGAHAKPPVFGSQRQGSSELWLDSGCLHGVLKREAEQDATLKQQGELIKQLSEQLGQAAVANARPSAAALRMPALSAARENAAQRVYSPARR